MSHKFTIFSKTDYLSHLTAEINKAMPGERVLLATFSFDPTSPHISHLLDALVKASSRGVRVHLAVDAFAFMANSILVPGPIWALPTINQPFTGVYKKKLNALKTLQSHGGHYVVTNLPKLPFSLIPAGRTHIKAAVVNNNLYLGGCNLEHPDEIDFMVELSSKDASDWVYKKLSKMITTGYPTSAFGSKDIFTSIPDIGALYIDVGKRNQSLILDEAYGVIDSAKGWLFMSCQYFPGGETAKHLLAAHKRGVKVEIAYNHPSVHGKIEALGHHAYNTREKIRLPKEFFNSKYADSKEKIHAKLIASDNSVIFGSHNFVTQGVTLGTAEIALLSHSPQLSNELVKSVKAQLDSAH